VCVEEGSFPVGLVVGGAVGAVLLIAIIAGIVICKRKRNAASTAQETAGGGGGHDSNGYLYTDRLNSSNTAGGGGVLTGNAKYEAYDQQDLFPGVAASPSAPKLPAPIPFSGRVQ
jgi:hypothetical protein